MAAARRFGVLFPRQVVNEPRNELGGAADAGVKCHQVSVGEADVDVAVRDGVTAPMRPPLGPHLARPPSDLSSEAERMFTRKARWNELAVCTQPSVSPSKEKGFWGRTFEKKKTKKTLCWKIGLRLVSFSSLSIRVQFNFSALFVLTQPLAGCLRCPST